LTSAFQNKKARFEKTETGCNGLFDSGEGIKSLGLSKTGSPLEKHSILSAVASLINLINPRFPKPWE